MSDVIRVGHKGADLLAPGNTTASFDAALAAGVDMIEFDVLPEVHHDPASRLVLAHDYTKDTAAAPSLEEGLAHLAGPAFDGMRLDVDLKLPGYEQRVLDALRDAGLLGRTLISSMERSSLHRLRALEEGLTLGWSVPKARRDYTKSPLWRIPAGGVLLVARRTFPRRAAIEVRSGFCDAIMAFHMLVSPALVEAVRGAGGELYAWTVDRADMIARLEAMGVTGIITNDPTLFPRRALTTR
ncbi:MAG: glycerophosphoryl diester phosphodiesterase [Solirubrobacteraceae bacterium]|jgi:glycerophosphoryl diester phosphodiesterase|nr:glycerophosphoryl diester phosphodiesterase [Solirubrobacteraceae bacterium]